MNVAAERGVVGSIPAGHAALSRLRLWLPEMENSAYLLRQREKCRSQGRVREILPDWSGCLRKCEPDPVHCQLLCLCPRFGLSLQTPCGAEKNFSNLWGIWWGKSAHNEKTLTIALKGLISFWRPQGDKSCQYNTLIFISFY